MELLETIYSRRAVPAFTTQSVDEIIFKKLIDVHIQAQAQ
jgi:hypothetical protein